MQDIPQCAASAHRRLPVRGGRRAFTLLEILLVLALIGLLTGVMVLGTARMLDPGPANSQQAFWAMVTEARRYALQHELTVRVSFDDVTASLVASADDGTVLPAVAVPEGTKFTFLPGLSTTTSPTSLLGGSALTDTPMPYVTFYADGTCALFRVQIDGGSTSTQLVQIDPWTCAPLFVSTGTTSTGI